MAIIHPADRLGMSRSEAAAYIGISATTFDGLVQRRLMPAPKQIGSRLLWDRRQVEIAFGSLPDFDVSTPIVEELSPWS